MLPPGFEHRPSHQYGELTVRVGGVDMPRVPVEGVELCLLGMRQGERRRLDRNEQAQFAFSIRTNLWHFYAYLNDARTLTLRFMDTRGNAYTSEMHINLMPSHQVLSRQSNNINALFTDNSYLLDSKSRCEVFDARFGKVGTAVVELDLTFQESINRTLMNANLIDFEDILVIDQISPISSKIDLNNMTAQIEQVPPIPISASLKELSKPSIIPESLRYLEEQVKLPPAPAPVPVSAPAPNLANDGVEDDEKMIEDDIDRLIAQMQSRPYDSSKYMEEAKEEPRKENFNYANFSLATAKSQSNEKRERMPSNEKQVRVPPMIKTLTHKPQFSPSPLKMAFTASNSLPHSPLRSLSQTQINVSQSKDQDRKSGMVKLKIHEFTMSKMERQLSLLLKVYLNEDNEEYYTINGLRQGETISFSSNIKINQKREINVIRFVLIDTYDMKTVFAQGFFEMDRLFSLNPTKGIFMVNLISAAPEQNFSKVIRMEEQSLMRVTPNLKNLRIQLQYEELIEIVQIFLSLSEFSSACRKISYKIPFTKETIEFRPSELANGKHINIFPHNRSSAAKANERMIIELWGDSELIGFNEVSLKPIAITNQSIINSSLEPVLLYDQARDVNDIKNGKSKASYWLKLYYGNISQVQGILNRDDRERRVEKPKTPVEVENRLGIYIKENKAKKEVEIQVDQEEMHEAWKGSQKNILSLQQEELPDDDEEEIVPQDSNLNTQENEFISHSMQQKYMNQQTLPILKPNSKISNLSSKSLELSKTIKTKTFKFLTKSFQEEIKMALSDFTSEQIFAELKQQCSSHLLFHFIQIHTLISIMKKLGISQKKIDFLLNDVILVTNDMININLLYDMILGLLLEGEVKEKFIDDTQIGRFCLMSLYKSLQEREEEDAEEPFLFDQNTEFDEARKVFETVECKLTMREFNLIHAFLKRGKEGNLTESVIREQLLSKHAQEVKESEVKQAKEKEVISKLYQHEWDEDDDFFICNINQHQAQDSSNCITTREAPSQVHQKESAPSFHATTLRDTPNDRDHSFNSITYNQLEPSQVTNQLAETFKPPLQKPRPNFKLEIEGLQSSCIDTIECLLNTPLTLPKLRVACRIESQEQQFWVNSTPSVNKYEIELSLRDEFVDGCIEFYEREERIAKCNMSVMAGMKSCYTLKHVETLEYCGILNLLLSPHQ